MEKLFKLKEHGTTVKTEIIAGITTFFAMAYIIFVNPNYLSATGMDFSSVMIATCLSAGIGTLLTGLLSNTPFAQAPGMGLNAFFAFTVCGSMGYTWQQALTVVLISGIIFLIIAITPLRSKIIEAIPAPLKAAISAGIGLFIAFIGAICSGSGLIFLDGESHITGLNLKVDGAFNMTAILIIIGIIITAILLAWKVKGALVIGIIASTVIGIPMGVTQIPETFVNTVQLNTVFQFDFGGLFAAQAGILGAITAIISFLIVDMFDTIGTLVGTAGNAGMLDEKGALPGGDRALIADAVATCVGACLGTSTVTTFVESSTGIAEGGRTGLTSVTTAILFFVAIILAPIAGIIPGAATAPALIIVGVMMMASVKKIDWHDIEVAIPSFLTMFMMIAAYSISDGISFGFISYVIIKLARGKVKEIPWLMYVISAVFILKYIIA